MSAYTKMIIEFTGCTEADAPLVEGMMRDQHFTLDNIDRRTFKRTAEQAYMALLWSRTPEGIAYQEQLKKEFYGI